MSAEKKATRPGSRWAHGKRDGGKGLPPPKKDAGKGYGWYAGARVRRPT